MGKLFKHFFCHPPLKYPPRLVLNALVYLTKSGCQ